MSDHTFRPGPDEAAWDSLLHQLRQQGQQPAPPFFYARVQQRLLAKTHRAGWQLPAWLRRPAYVAVLAALVLAVSGDAATAAPGNAGGLPAPHHGR